MSPPLAVTATVAYLRDMDVGKATLTEEQTSATCSEQRERGRHHASVEGDLLQAVRDGDGEAYGVLYQRHHDAVDRLARRLCRDRQETDDVVSDVFCNMLSAVRNGSGPQRECRAYLLRSVRHTLIKRRTRKDTGRAIPCPPADLDRRGADDVTLAGGPATDALHGVSEHFQELLWFVEVQGHDSADVAAETGVAKPAAASMVYRARRALRRAYLGGCVSAPVHDEACVPIRSLLPAFVDGDVHTAGAERVRQHLASCERCTQALTELNSVYDRIGRRGILALLPGALRALIGSSAQVVGTAVGVAPSLAAATIAVGALALPASEDVAVGDASATVAVTVPTDRRTGTTTRATTSTTVTSTTVTTTATPQEAAVVPASGDEGPEDEDVTSASVPVGAPVSAPVPSAETSPSTTAAVAIPVPAGVPDPAVVPADPIGEVGRTVDDLTHDVAQTAEQTVSGVVGVVGGAVAEVGEVVDGAASAVAGPGGLVDHVVATVPVVSEVDEGIDRATDELDDLVARTGDGVDDVLGAVVEVADGGLARTLLGGL